MSSLMATLSSALPDDSTVTRPDRSMGPPQRQGSLTRAMNDTPLTTAPNSPNM